MLVFFDHALGLTRWGWALLVTLTVATTGWCYTDKQVDLQRQMFSAVERVDVLANFCADAAALGDACGVGQLGESDDVRRLSDQAIWHLLGEAELIDTELVEWPGALADGSAPLRARGLHDFLAAADRRGERGVRLLDGAAQLCGGGRSDIPGADNADAIWIAMVTRLLAGTGQVAGRSAREYLGDPRDPQEPVWPSATFEASEATRLRFAVPERLPDAHVVAALVGLSNGFDLEPAALGQGLSLTGKCRQPVARLTDENTFTEEPFTEEQLYGVALGRIELALWIAGQIRRDDGVALASAEAALYTGPEQAGILAVFAFGVWLAAFRLMCLVTRQRRGGATIGPAKEGVVDPALARMRRASASEWGHWRAQLTQGIASARWPLPLAAVLLPALGFVGTVRGIKNSLTGADGLVFANTLNERADEIAALAGDLGLAFGTTFLALLGSVVLTVALAIEGRLIDILVIRLLDTAPQPGRRSHEGA